MKKNKVVIMLVVALVFSSIWVAFGKKQSFEENSIKNDKEYISDEENEKEYIYSKEDEGVVSDESPIDEESITRYDSDNGIDMAVIFNNVLEQDDDKLVFKVMVNNLRIDLENIQYTELVKLKLSDGRIIDQGFEWEILGHGHHTFGYLKLPKVYNGKNIIDQNIDSMKLEFEGIGDAEKLSFEWGKEILDIYTSRGEEYEK